MIDNINNPRTDSIIEAAAQVTRARQALAYRQKHHAVHDREYNESLKDLKKKKDDLTYALRRLDKAAR